MLNPFWNFRVLGALGIASEAVCSVLPLTRRRPLEDDATSRTCRDTHSELSGLLNCLSAEALAVIMIPRLLAGK